MTTEEFLENEDDCQCGIGPSDICPYDQDVLGEENYCSCCDSCRESCADNI